MSDAMTSHGFHDGATTRWPYVTVPADEFDAHAEHVTSFSRNKFVWFTPIINDLAAWNDYSKDISNGKDVPTSPDLFVYEAGRKRPVNGTGPFIPIHQMYPKSTLLPSINSSIINYDTSSEPNFATTTKQVSILRHSLLTGFLSLTVVRDSYPKMFDASEPLSVLVEPIFSSFEETSSIVGYVQSLFEWKFFFSNLASDGIDVVCVVENTCGDIFTFTIDHNTSSYSLNEDAHAGKFNDLSASTVLGLDDISESNLEKAKAAGMCIYTMTIYPTEDFRQKFDANTALYTTVVGIIMLCMVGAFFAYDSYVLVSSYRTSFS